MSAVTHYHGVETSPVSPAERVRRAVVGAPRLLLAGLIRAYQLLVSPMTGPSCRYYPSCSSYALVAVQRHGALRGSWLAVRRLLRCHPWAAGGVDDVPPRRKAAQRPTVR